MSFFTSRFVCTTLLMVCLPALKLGSRDPQDKHNLILISWHCRNISGDGYAPSHRLSPLEEWDSEKKGTIYSTETILGKSWEEKAIGNTKKKNNNFKTDWNSRWIVHSLLPPFLQILVSSSLVILLKILVNMRRQISYKALNLFRV